MHRLACVLLLQNVFSYDRMCSRKIECGGDAFALKELDAQVSMCSLAENVFCY